MNEKQLEAERMAIKYYVVKHPQGWNLMIYSICFADSTEFRESEGNIT